MQEWKMKDIMDGEMKIMTAIIDSKTLDIIYIGLMLLYSIYVIREKKIVLSDQKYFIRYLPMNYIEYQIVLKKSYRIILNHLRFIRLFE